MSSLGLRIRLAVAGTVLFAFYSLLALVLAAGGLPVPIVLLLTLAFVGIQYVAGKRLALWHVGARDMSEDRFQSLLKSNDRLADAMGIDAPRMMVADMGVPNAFAVGRKGAGVVVLSSELLYALDSEAVHGVLAHELAHIRNRDVVLMVLGQSIASMVAISVQLGLAAVPKLNNFLLRWIVGNLVYLSVVVFVLVIARHREYVADAEAAALVGGEPLARALEMVSDIGDRSPSRVDDAVAALCIYGGDRGLIERLLATHPPVERRIERLRSG